MTGGALAFRGEFAEPRTVFTCGIVLRTSRLWAVAAEKEDRELAERAVT